MPNFTVLNGKVDITDGENYYVFFVRDVESISRTVTPPGKEIDQGRIPIINLEISFFDRRKVIKISKSKIICDKLDRLYQTIKGEI